MERLNSQDSPAVLNRKIQVKETGDINEVMKTARTTKRKTSAKRRPAPRIDRLIVKAVSESKERSGVSLATLKNALSSHGYDVEKNNSRIKIAVRKLLRKGTLAQTKGSGAVGLFKLGNTRKRPTKRRAASKTKRRTASKKRRAKKPAKKRAAKKSTKRVKKRKARKSAKRPKKARAAKPKRAKRRTAKPKKRAKRI